MEGFSSENFSSPESIESLPISEYIFCNNHEVLCSVFAPNEALARDMFESRQGRRFGSENGDSFTSIPLHKSAA